MIRSTGNYVLNRKLAIAAVFLLLCNGCHFRRQSPVSLAPIDCKDNFTQIEYPKVCDSSCEDTGQFQTQAPPTASNFYQQEAWPMTLEQAVEMALANNKVLQKLGGRVLTAPAGTQTIYDPAILETNPFNSAEAALSAFDAQFVGSATYNRSERLFNNIFFGGGAASLDQNNGIYRADLSKTTANGATFTVRNLTDYTLNNNPGNLFASVYETVFQAEWRQPLGRGAGTAVNRIAGPNAGLGNYNGVLIGRIRGDIALNDFEAAVRDLVRDVELTYWELYFAYRNLDVQIRAREDSRLIWDNRKKRVDAGLSRPDDEAQARQQYYNFEQQVIDALSGNASGQTGVLGYERQLRRLLGLLNNDGRLIRPVTEPTIAPIVFDWQQSQQQALINRVELRRQKWNVRQRELELFAARKLNKWRFDFVGNVGARGFGDNLFGSSGTVNGSAVNSLLTGNLDEWSFAFELQGPVGNRQGHLAIRNAELQLIREKSLLEEQQKQLLLDLNAAFTEVDRAYQSIKTSFNTRQAVLDELEPKGKRADAGDEDLFFLLDAQQRASQTETAFHRAVVDYNLALQNYVYTSGGMLEYYNVRLIEGDWSTQAQVDAQNKDTRHIYGQPNSDRLAVSNVSAGATDQWTDTALGVQAFGITSNNDLFDNAEVSNSSDPLDSQEDSEDGETDSSDSGPDNLNLDLDPDDSETSGASGIDQQGSGTKAEI